MTTENQLLREAVFTVLEGFTIPHDVRTILETAYYAALTQPAQPAEGGEAYEAIYAAWKGCGLDIVQGTDWRRFVGMLPPLYTTPPASQEQAPAYTYASTQATMCASCGAHKHTPLRIDAMGGYVCLTCIDRKLGSLLGEFGYPEPDEDSQEQAQEPSGGEVVAWTESKPKKPGVYGWRGSPASYDMVHVHTRPTEHSPGGQLNGSCLSGKGFYHGCAITSWGGEWIGPLDTLTLATPKPEPMTWQPIATAPKDGTAILVSGGCFIFCVEWNNEFDWWAVDDNKLGPFRLRGAAPTHWMPLPPAPITKEQA